MLTNHRWVQGWSINGFGTLFGGQLLSWVDEDTNMLAYNSSLPGSAYTTAGYDRVSFLRPCKAGDRLKFAYDIVHYGAKSITIRTIITNQDGDKVFSCLTTMVRFDDMDPKKGLGGVTLLPEIIKKIDKNSWPWRLVEQLRELRKRDEPL